MGLCQSVEVISKEATIPSQSTTIKEPERKSFRQIPSDMSIHIVLSDAYDHHHDKELLVPLGDCSDEALIAEAMRRKLDLNSEITDAFVQETYEFGPLIGKGGSGSVYQVKHRISNVQYACKIVKWNRVMNDMQSMISEIEIMKHIHHRNVLSMYELYQTPRALWMILELVSGGDLSHYIASYPNYNEVIACKLMKQILLGIEYLHEHRIIHRDIKPENILLSTSQTTGEVKIADFGLSTMIGVHDYQVLAGNLKQCNILTDVWGTREYFAPELIDRHYGFQVDIWSCGCILYELVIGKQVFAYNNYFDSEQSFYKRVKSGKYNQNMHEYRSLSSNLRNLISSMLQVDPRERFSAKECLSSSWINGNIDQDRVNVELTHCQERIRQRLEDRERWNRFISDEDADKDKKKDHKKTVSSSNRSSTSTLFSFFQNKSTNTISQGKKKDIGKEKMVPSDLRHSL
jgi:serine/threonine protein kinase